MTVEAAVVIPCGADVLTGILHHGHHDARVGVVVIVGGPQYRVGSHRQFVLLARALAQSGIPVLRFDYRGMGDSSGTARSFEHVNDDIRAAITALTERVPGVTQIVLWGLCDAASAALFYAPTDTRVAGLVLLNPWVRTEAGMARAYLKHYYLRRFFSGDFWKKVFSGQWRAGASLKSLTDLTAKLQTTPAATSSSPSPENARPLPERMLAAWEKFDGPVLLMLSGNNDYVADEFRDVVKASRRWRKRLKRAHTTQHDIPEANHTFSRGAWRDQVSQRTDSWITENFR